MSYNVNTESFPWATEVQSQSVDQRLNPKKMPLKRQRLKERSRLLPQQAIDIMTQWYHLHYAYPYPNNHETERLAELGGITRNQVKQWFVNIRRRTENPARIRREYKSSRASKEDNSIDYQAPSQQTDTYDYYSTQYQAPTLYFPTKNDSIASFDSSVSDDSSFNSTQHSPSYYWPRYSTNGSTTTSQPASSPLTSSYSAYTTYPINSTSAYFNTYYY